MADRVIFTDLELFLAGFIRAELAVRGVTGGFISNEFSPSDLPRPLFQVVVRDDGGPRSGAVTKSPTAGVTVLGSESYDKADTAALASLVFAITEGCARVEPGNPVAAVVSSAGPFRVPDDSGHSRRYMTFGLSIVGEPFE